LLRVLGRCFQTGKIGAEDWVYNFDIASCFLSSAPFSDARWKQSGKLPDFGLWPKQGIFLVLIFNGGLLCLKNCFI